MRTTLTCCSNPPRAGHAAAPRRLGRRIFVGGDAMLPRLLPLDVVIIPIALGDLALFVLCLVCSTLPLRDRLVPVKNRLLREMRLGRNKVRTLQLQQQEGREVSQSRRSPRRSTSQQKHRTNKMYREDVDSQFFQSPRGGALGVATPTAMSRSTSRLHAPRDARPQVATGGTKRSRSPSKGVGRPSSRRDERAASGAARLLVHGTA
jgi:hypothetical protein